MSNHCATPETDIVLSIEINKYCLPTVTEKEI